ncbi:MAG: hypothetical protein QOD71_1791 [Thermoleophilaceae bacterium]|jgi:hypothetical protein|nr:hypothetical protein [Thermoleophilaceae bacterium]
MAKNTKQQTGVAGLVDQVTRVLDRGGRRGPRGGGGATGKAASFVAGFLHGGDDRKKGRGGRRRGR